MLQQLMQNPDAPISLVSLVINIAIGIVGALILRWHFTKFASTLSNREQFALTFPFILLTTLLIITVVKSSLALSLGLVGALSIVRFRTPIKEPEELAYLFMAIAIGLGLGANQTAPTIVAAVIILGLIALLKWRRLASSSENLYLSVDLKNPSESDPGIDDINRILSGHVRTSDLRRFDARGGSIEATYLVSFENSGDLSALVAALRREYPTIGVTFIDQNQIPSV